MVRFEQWTAEEIRQEFEEITRRVIDDPFTFTVTSVHTIRDVDVSGYDIPATQVRIQVNFGMSPFESFTVDVTAHRHTQEPVATIAVVPLIGQIMDNWKPGEFSIETTAIESHLADKVCAMYTDYSGKVSTRYRDLADIITIIDTTTFTAGKLFDTLEHEAARRRVVLPQELVKPGEAWESGFAQHAKENANLRIDAHTLTGALEYAGRCLNPVLAARLPKNAHWSYQTHSWIFPQDQ